MYVSSFDLNVHAERDGAGGGGSGRDIVREGEREEGERVKEW